MAIRVDAEAALAIGDPLGEDAILAEYHLPPRVRRGLFAKLGRHDDALEELERAASLTQNTRERALLLARAEACSSRA